MNFASLLAHTVLQLCRNQTEVLWITPADPTLAAPKALSRVRTYIYCDKPFPHNDGYPYPSADLCDYSCGRSHSNKLDSVRAPLSAGLEFLIRVLPNHEWVVPQNKRSVFLVLDRPIGFGGALNAARSRWNSPRVYPPGLPSSGGWGSLEFANWGLLSSLRGPLPRASPEMDNRGRDGSNASHPIRYVEATDSPLGSGPLTTLRSMSPHGTCASREELQSPLELGICLLLKYIKFSSQLRAQETTNFTYHEGAETDGHSDDIKALKEELGPEIWPSIPKFKLDSPCDAVEYPSAEDYARFFETLRIPIFVIQAGATDLRGSLPEGSSVNTLTELLQALHIAQAVCNADFEGPVILGIVGAVGGTALLGGIIVWRVSRSASRGRLSLVTKFSRPDSAGESDTEQGSIVEHDRIRFQWFDRVTLSMFEPNLNRSIPIPADRTSPSA